MKSPASAREEKERNNYTINHGESSLMRYSLWFIVFAGAVFLAACCYSSPVFAQEPQRGLLLAPPLPAETGFSQGEIKRLTLDNGMVLLLKENHRLPLVNVFLCVRTGSAGEGKFGGCGISHFVEHMVFKGTSSRRAGDVFREIESYGGNINASTSYDYTAFSITAPREFVSPALEIAADMVMNASFDGQELERERQVILKELALSYDSPQRYASRLLWQSAYLTHTYKYPILGEEQLLKSLSREDLLEFYQTKYTPDNMILSIVGDVETEATVTFIKELFKDFQRKSISGLAGESEPEQKELRRHQEEFTSGLTYLLLGFHSVAITDEDCFALDVLAAVLGEGESSRLQELICNKRKLAYTLEAINYTPYEPGLFIISSLLEEARRKQALSLILNQIELVKKEEVAENELESAKNKIISVILFHNQTIEAQAQDLALNEAQAADYRFTERYIQKIRKVSSQDILMVADKYLQRNNLSIVALIPRDKPAGIKRLTRETPERLSEYPHLSLRATPHLMRGSEAISDEIASPLTSLSPRNDSFQIASEIAPIKSYVFDNGLRLLVREDRNLPLVSIKAVFKGGLRAEGRDTNGLCNLTAEMLDKGTRSKNAAEIAYLVESKGAHLSSFSGNNSFGLSLDLLSKDFDPMLRIFVDLIVNSTFPQREFKKQKEKKLAQIKAREDDIFESGKKLLKLTLFQKHPYRFSTIGSESSLNKLRRRQLTSFHRSFCVGENMVLTVFGDVNAQEVAAKVKKLFGELESGQPAAISVAEEVKVKTVRRASEFLPKKQSLVLMGFYGTTVFNQDRYALELISQILSRPSGKLFTQIREKAGLAYALGAYSVLGLDPGCIVIYVATAPENVETVRKEILRQLRLLKQESLSEEELAQAKRALLGERLISRQTNSACALESSLDELYGLGHSHYLEYGRQINQIEAGDIKRCAEKYFDLSNYAVVVVGPHSTDQPR